MLLVFEEDSEKKMFEKYISKIFYKLYEENLKNEKYFSSYKLLDKTQEYCENKDKYKEKLKIAESFKIFKRRWIKIIYRKGLSGGIKNT